MEDFFNQIGGLISGVFALAQGGFDGVNQITGLLIALVAALLMTGWKRLWATALGATAAHIAIGVLRPVLDGGAFVLPDLLTIGFWMAALALFLGYVVVIAVFFLIKSLVAGGSHKASHAH